jgi:hypothetical protein
VVYLVQAVFPSGPGTILGKLYAGALWLVRGLCLAKGTNEVAMRLPRRFFFAMQFAAVLLGLLTPQVGFAYDHPLTDEAVRDGYFLGQDLDRANDSLAQYVHVLPIPDTGPQVAEIELLTPYAQVVQVSHEHPMGYSAQQAASDYKARGDSIQVRVKVLFTPTYTGAEDFWRGVSVGLVQKKHMAATKVSAQLLYASDPDGDNSWITGANVFIQFSVAGVDSDSVDVEVIPPGGASVHATFDLGRLS